MLIDLKKCKTYSKQGVQSPDNVLEKRRMKEVLIMNSITVLHLNSHIFLSQQTTVYITKVSNRVQVKICTIIYSVCIYIKNILNIFTQTKSI